MGQILKAAYQAGLGFYIAKAGIGWCAPLYCRIKCFLLHKKCAPVELPSRFRELLEELGPTFIKFGQILSMRPDFIPEKFIHEFQKLQEHAPELPFRVIKQTIEQELGSKIEDQFDEFHERPLAAASLGQVHEAKLNDGTRVAVKVQRPNIRKNIESDLRILCFIAKQFEKHVPEVAPYRPLKAMESVRITLLKELDYQNEGRNAERFAYNFQQEPGIKIPLIYWDYSSCKVLTMEYIEGIRMGDAQKISEAGLDHHLLMKNCTRACTLPCLSHGFFHADPHPGNVLALSDHRVCYLDFGMVGSISKKLRHKLLLILLYFVNEEIDLMVEALIKLVEVDQLSDVEGYREHIYSSLVHFFLNRQDAESMTNTLFEIITSASQFSVYFPEGMTMLVKAMVTGESMCRLTHKDMDYMIQSRQVIQEIYKDEFGLKNILATYKNILPNIIEKMIELPEQLLSEHSSQEIKMD